MMARQLEYRCGQHASPWDCPDVTVVRLRDGRYGLPVRDGERASAGSFVEIWHCPWCGTALPGHVPHPAPEPEIVGKALTEDEVELRMAAWHGGSGGISKLHEYLGWTWDEYTRWANGAELPTS